MRDAESLLREFQEWSQNHADHFSYGAGGQTLAEDVGYQGLYLEVTEFLSHKDLALALAPEFGPDLKMLEAIIHQLETGHRHGGFIDALCHEDYAQAAYRADADNSRHLCDLIKFRGWVKAYGLEWGKEQITLGKAIQG